MYIVQYIITINIIGAILNNYQLIFINSKDFLKDF